MKVRRIVLVVCGLGPKDAGLLTLDAAFARSPGIRRAYVNPTSALAYVEFEPRTVRQEHLVAAIEHAGFDVGQLTVI
jgi:hypothetical protein